MVEEKLGMDENGIENAPAQAPVDVMLNKLNDES